MARYQMSYGFIENQTEDEKDKAKEGKKEKPDPADGKRKAQEPPRK